MVKDYDHDSSSYRYHPSGLGPHLVADQLSAAAGTVPADYPGDYHYHRDPSHP